MDRVGTMASKVAGWTRWAHVKKVDGENFRYIPMASRFVLALI